MPSISESSPMSTVQLPLSMGIISTGNGGGAKLGLALCSGVSWATSSATVLWAGTGASLGESGVKERFKDHFRQGSSVR